MPSEISTILRDRAATRTIAYPIGGATLSEALADVISLQNLALYYLYDSSPQIGHYDPAKSNAERYPVLVARRGLPTLSVPTLVGDLADNPEARSILIFPVKARIKGRVTESLRDVGLRALRKWMARDVPQRDLVLSYDETTHSITPKFAEDWDGTEIERVYT